jgi:hypothetical protein
MINQHLDGFLSSEEIALFDENGVKSDIDSIIISGREIKKITKEFWTAKQRQANSIHEISYRACFKPQLPNFFITKLTKEGDYVYDPFLGRGTTIIEAGLLNRKVIGNDINPLSIILCEGRFLIPDLKKLEKYLETITLNKGERADIDLTMFYHPDTEGEIVSLKKYLNEKAKNNELNDFDKWIRMVATNRLTGHSKGFFSVYTMPPNQAVSSDRQIKINQKYNQTPEYRNVKHLILKKSKDLIKNMDSTGIKRLKNTHKEAILLNSDARQTKDIPSDIVKLTVTSPPFLDVIQYAEDNWLRCWFNNIDTDVISQRITMSKTIEQWNAVMQDVFGELFRITQKNGFVAFEVGEIRNGKIKLEEHVLPLGINAGFEPIAILINEQEFTKTANIWGVSNNKKGTNSNRIVLFQKK